MRQARPLALGSIVITALLLHGCGSSRPDKAATAAASPTEQPSQELNLYWWSEFLAPDTLKDFEQKTGIKVRISYYDSEETLETKMLTGRSGFDVVVPAAPYYFGRQVRSGAYHPLNSASLPNRKNLDPALMARVATVDPGNAHGVIYMWGTIGIGYNREQTARVLDGQPINSWRAVFDPANAAKLASCGIQLLNSPAEVVRVVLIYLGKNPNDVSPENMAAVEKVLESIRPSLRIIDSSGYIDALANGDICVAIGYNGDFVQARRRAREAGNHVQVAYANPIEGSIVYFNMLAIPADAPHVDNAHRFINFLMEPREIAKISNFVGYASANSVAAPFVDATLTADDAAYPTLEQQRKLQLQTTDSPEQSRAITRLWQKFMTGQ